MTAAGERGAAEEGGTAGPEVGIGIIGYGMMGKAHSYGYTLAPHIRPVPRATASAVMASRTT